MKIQKAVQAVVVALSLSLIAPAIYAGPGEDARSARQERRALFIAARQERRELRQAARQERRASRQAERAERRATRQAKRQARKGSHSVPELDGPLMPVALTLLGCLLLISLERRRSKSLPAA